MPEGWKSGLRNLGGSKDLLGVFEAPDGKFCAGRRLAITHAKNVLKYDESDILLMRTGLIEKDGWSSSDKLPEKWLVKEYKSGKSRSLYFLNQEFHLFSSGFQAFQELVQKDYSEKHINLFMSGFIDQSINPEEIIWENDKKQCIVLQFQIMLF